MMIYRWLFKNHQPKKQKHIDVEEEKENEQEKENEKEKRAAPSKKKPFQRKCKPKFPKFNKIIEYF